MTWHSIPVPITELCIDTTLRSGQSFRWRQLVPGEYSCALRGRLITLKQDANNLYYKAVFPPTLNKERFALTEDPATPRTDSDLEEAELKETRQFLYHYLNLRPDLGALYAEWSEKDANFSRKAPKFTGVRILKQDAWETLVGFICSACNNIKRISQMMDKLCANYGPLIGYIDDVPFYDMPSPSALINPRVDAHLRELGFGYRAPYLHQTAQMITREADGWLDSLRNPENPVFGGVESPAGEMKPEGRDGYREAHAALVQLQGVGAKVADCVCLFGLGWGEAVPVDTHVWQIAQRDYGFGKGKHKSLTKATYDAVGNHFRGLWGTEAGWAHSVLFTADLPAFAAKLKSEVVKEEYIKAEVMDVTPSRLVPLTPRLALTPMSATRLAQLAHASSPALIYASDSADESVDDLYDDEDFVSPKQEIKTEIKSELITPVRRTRRGTSTIEEIKSEVKEELVTLVRGSRRGISGKEEIKSEIKAEIEDEPTPTKSRKRKAIAIVKEEVILNRTEDSSEPAQADDLVEQELPEVKTERTEPTLKRTRSGRVRA